MFLEAELLFCLGLWQGLCSELLRWGNFSRRSKIYAPIRPNIPIFKDREYRLELFKTFLHRNSFEHKPSLIPSQNYNWAAKIKRLGNLRCGSHWHPIGIGLNKTKQKLPLGIASDTRPCYGVEPSLLPHYLPCTSCFRWQRGEVFTRLMSHPPKQNRDIAQK